MVCIAGQSIDGGRCHGFGERGYGVVGRESGTGDCALSASYVLSGFVYFML